MHLINLSLVFLAGLNMGMAFIIFLRNPKNKINISFALSILFIAIWILGIGMFREASSEVSAWAWTWVQNGAGALIPIPFLLFSVYFPYQKFEIKIWQRVLIFLSIIVVSYVVVKPGIWVSEIQLNPPFNDYTLNFWGLLYFNAHLFAYLILAFHNLLVKYKESQGLMKKQLGFMIIAMSIIAFFGSLYAAIVPLITQSLGNYWLGAFFSVPMIMILSYFIFRS